MFKSSAFRTISQQAAVRNVSLWRLVTTQFNCELGFCDNLMINSAIKQLDTAPTQSRSSLMNLLEVESGEWSRGVTEQQPDLGICYPLIPFSGSCLPQTFYLKTILFWLFCFRLVCAIFHSDLILHRVGRIYLVLLKLWDVDSVNWKPQHSTNIRAVWTPLTLLLMATLYKWGVIWGKFKMCCCCLPSLENIKHCQIFKPRISPSAFPPPHTTPRHPAPSTLY